MFYSLPVKADWSIKPTIEIRERFERRVDKDFNEDKNDNRSDLFSRWRVGVDFNYKKDISGKVVYQYSHDEIWTDSLNYSVERSDLLLAYVDFKFEGGTTRLGRQFLIKGNERLIGAGDWGMTARTWDMARWTGGRWDLWAGKLAVNSAPSRDAILAGGSYGSKYGETMFNYKHDKYTGLQDDIYTLSHLWKWKKDKWSADVEGAAQTGRTGDSKLEAWAGSARIGYQYDKKLKFYAEGNVASGGKKDDGTVLTFDQLYATNHTKYGITDMQGWRNMQGLSLGVNFKPTNKISLNAEYNKFGLRVADDAWYGDSGKGNKGFKDATGNSGRDVGDEFDLWGSYTIDSRSTFEGGIGIFRPGRFIESFSQAGDQNQVWGYVQYKIKF